jgi:hypothetical protein
LTSYRWIGNYIASTADGHILEPGVDIELEKDAVEDPENARLIEEGLLVETPPEAKTTKKGAGEDA